MLMLGWQCSHIKPMGLYDQALVNDVPHINDYYSLNVFSDQITNDVWFTQAITCLNIHSESSEVKSGSGAISIEWNKQAGDCPWMGMGIGWDNWSGKNFESILNSAALSFWVKMKEGKSVGLPWAVGFEDFTGGQAWTGVTADCISGGTITNQWTQVILPLNRFPFLNNDVDVTSIKQVIFQFESSGKVLVDEISMIPFNGKSKKELIISTNKDAKIQSIALLPVGNIEVNWDEFNLYLSAKIKDESPLINEQTDRNIWNGDAIEIAFSSAAGVDPNRKIYYSTDHHLGVRMSIEPFVYDWKSEKVINEVVVKTSITDDGYTMSLALPWKSIAANPWQLGESYDIELAIDAGDHSGKRTMQYRWNSPGNEGFNFNPSLWGAIHLQP
jgi:hypothetical protein